MICSFDGFTFSQLFLYSGYSSFGVTLAKVSSFCGLSRRCGDYFLACAVAFAIPSSNLPLVGLFLSYWSSRVQEILACALSWCVFPMLSLRLKCSRSYIKVSDPILNWFLCAGWERWICFHLSVCENLILPAPVVKEASLLQYVCAC